VKRFDAIVIGGGPAGSTTALRLADAGASVLVADKARFPRDKPCGGGLTMRAVRNCPVDPTPVVEELVDVVEIRFRYGDRVVRESRAPFAWMTQRRRLDAFLLDAARERGAEVLEGVSPKLEPAADGAPNVVVLGSGERVEADVVVGADGANGTIARTVGLGGGIVHGVAYEGNVPFGAESGSSVSRERYERRCVIELADIPGGYGWVFPKGDHVNVGVGAWKDEGPRIREHLARMCAGHGLDPASLSELRGHRLPLRVRGTRVAGERVLLVGDAAGLVDPVTGDGMYECFVSSQLATDAVLDLLAGRATSLEPYEAALEAKLAPLHRASWKLKIALDRWPRASWRLVRTGLVWRSIDGLLQGELAHPGEQHGLARVPMRALAILGRP
jgi:geranylgeranyl reductase family protein